MIIRVVVSIVSFLALGWTQFTETQNSTERRYRERQEMGRNHNTQSPRCAAESPLGSYTGVLAPSRSGSFLFDHYDIDLPVLVIARLVAEIKNASRKAKPLRTIIE